MATIPTYLQSAKANLDHSVSNQYYASLKQQQTHFGANSKDDKTQQQHWYESRTPIGAAKIPGPRGNPHLIRQAPEPTNKPATNSRAEAQSYMKMLYDKKLNEWDSSREMYHHYASPNWIGSAKSPGPYGNPRIFSKEEDFRNHEMVAAEKPNPVGAATFLARNQHRCYNQLGNELEKQIDRAFTGRIFGQNFQERTEEYMKR